MSGQQIRTFAEAVEQYAQLGLRTLCLAWRELDDDEYQEWALMFKEANSTLVDREVTLDTYHFSWTPFLPGSPSFCVKVVVRLNAVEILLTLLTVFCSGE